MDDMAIKAEKVSKNFKLPHEKHSSLKSAFVNIVHPNRGYEVQQALEDISFEIKKGEFFGIVGRNGSGKSTLLKLLAGIYAPTEGAIQVNGKLTPFIELGVGFNPELTGRENVYLNGALLGFNRRDMQSMYHDIVEFAELEKFMDQKLKNYSSGMQVRLAFSIAIRAETDILLLDEVLAVGDIAFQKKCYSYFEQLKAQGKTVVLVSHDMAAIEKYCTQAFLIHRGKIIDGGDPKEIASKYRLLNMEDISKKDSGVPELFGDVSINKVTINGKKEVNVKNNSELKVEVDLSVKKNKSAYVAISIFSADDTHIAYLDTRDALKEEIKRGESYRASCSFNAGQFLKGAYRIDVDVYDIEAIYLAKKPGAVHFSVDESSPSKAGLFNLNGEWIVKKIN